MNVGLIKFLSHLFPKIASISLPSPILSSTSIDISLHIDLNSDSFILSAATNPDLSWNESNGTHTQIQLSISRDFKADEDDSWYYNTQDNSSLFTLGTNDGSMTIPAGHDLSNSTSMHYRMRSIDSSGTIGQWEIGYFHLPGHNVTEDSITGYGNVTITFDDLGLLDKTIEDTYVDSNGIAKNSYMGTDGS